MARPSANDSAPFYHNYIELAKGNSPAEVINNHSAEILNFYTSLPEEKANHAYAEGKWTVKEMLQHVIDAERVFTYRALRFARKDETPLAGFDENAYALNANAANRPFNSLKEEFTALRKSADVFAAALNDEQLQQTGTASGKQITANALVYIIYGHLLHHINILKERYL